MNIYILNKDKVIKQTVQNMIEAGVVKPEEYDMFTNQLQQLNSSDLAIVLLKSHNLREHEKERIKFYPIDTDAISMN